MHRSDTNAGCCSRDQTSNEDSGSEAREGGSRLPLAALEHQSAIRLQSRQLAVSLSHRAVLDGDSRRTMTMRGSALRVKRSQSIAGLASKEQQRSMLMCAACFTADRVKHTKVFMRVHERRFDPIWVIDGVSMFH